MSYINNTERFREENVVMRNTGLSRNDVRRINPEQFREIAEKAYKEGTSGHLGPMTKSKANSESESESEDFRESVLDKLREAKSSTHGKPVDNGTPDALNQHNTRREEQVPAHKDTDAAAATTGTPGGGDSEGGAWETFELCGGVQRTFWTLPI